MVIIVDKRITEYGTYKGKHINLFILKNIIKSIIKILVRPFLYLYFIFKYHNIWNLKKDLTNKNKGLLLSYYLEYFTKRGAYVGVNARFKDIPCLPHGVLGLFVSNDAEIGKNCVIFQQVTIGSNTILGSKNFGSPKIGDNVYIGAGAKIIGNITIGDNCRIGANAVVTKSMEPNTVAVSAPTKFILKNDLDNRYIIKGKKDNYYYKDGSYYLLEDYDEKK